MFEQKAGPTTPLQVQGALVAQGSLQNASLATYLAFRFPPGQINQLVLVGEVDNPRMRANSICLAIQRTHHFNTEHGETASLPHCGQNAMRQDG